MADGALGSLGRATVRIELAGVQYEVPYRPAGHWLGVMADKSPTTILARMVDDAEGEEILMSMAEGVITRQQLQDASLKLLTEASGWKWWEAFKLALCSDEPATLGRLVLSGARPWEVSLAEWLAATYALFTQNAKPEDQFKFDAMLSAPPPGFDDEWDDKAAFDSMVQAARSMPGMR